MEGPAERQTESQRLLARRVAAYKARHKLTLQQLAERLGWHYATLSRVINGATGMRPKQEEQFRDLVTSEDLTVRQEELASMIEQMRPREVEAASQILQIMQNLRRSVEQD
jgi:transcriptional regulator with XRE-family HTH domain